MARVEMTVMGGGIFGLSIAWEAARRGARVRVIETARIGAGSSGGLVGALSPHVPEQWNQKKAFQFESLMMAEGWWRAVEATSGLSSGYGRIGRLQGLADMAAVDLARSRAVGAEKLWRGTAEWRVVRCSGAPWEPASASGWMVQDTLSGRVQPRAALKALVAAIRALGGEVVEHDAIAEGAVVWATGVAGLQALRAGSGVKGQALAVRFEARDQPQLFVDGLHIVPHTDGTVAIGSTSETTWQDPAAVDDLGKALLGRAVAMLPVLNGAEVVALWAGVRPRAQSRAPILGAWPGREGHYVANGGFKIGFGMAPKVAEVMADLILEGHDTIPDEFRI